VPVLEVLGVGAVVEAVPPVEASYHLSELPEAAVAVSADAVTPWHNSFGVVTVGASGVFLTLTSVDTAAAAQPLMDTVRL